MRAVKINSVAAGGEAGGLYNTAIGADAMAIGDGSGGYDTAVGFQAGEHLGGGLTNTAIGTCAECDVTTGNYNVALGDDSGYSNTTGSDNTALGSYAMNGSNQEYSNEVMSSTTAVGFESLYDVTSGDGNTAVGSEAGFGAVVNVSSVLSQETLLGFRSGYDMILGSGNTALGYESAYDTSSSSDNIIIGQHVDSASTTLNQELNIGNLIYGTNVYSGSSMSSYPVLGTAGISSSTPYGEFGIHAPFGGTNTLLFNIASSSQSATTSLFSVSNTGVASTTSLVISNVRNSLVLTTSNGTATAFTGSGTCGGTTALVQIGANGSGSCSSSFLTSAVTSITNGGALDNFTTLTTTGTITGQVGTSSVPTISQLAYWTSAGTPSQLSSVATTTTGTANDILSLNSLGGATIVYASSTAMSSTYASSTLLYIGTDPKGVASTSVSTPTGNIFLVHSIPIVVSSSTLLYLGQGYGTSGTTTIYIANPIHSSTLLSYFCKSDVGTYYVGFGNGTATTTETKCTASGTTVTVSSNNTWTGRQNILMDIGDEATNPNIMTITADVEDSN